MALQAPLNVPWLTPLASVKPKCVCNENLRWDVLPSPAAQAQSLERGAGHSQLIFSRSPEETEEVLPTPLA